MVKGIFQTFADGDQELLQALREFNEFRQKKKKSLTDEAKRRFCKKLEKYPREQWIDLIHQSIDRGWSGLYNLKEDKNAPVSGAPDKWANSPAYLQAIQDILKEGKAS